MFNKGYVKCFGPEIATLVSIHRKKFKDFSAFLFSFWHFEFVLRIHWQNRDFKGNSFIFYLIKFIRFNLIPQSNLLVEVHWLALMLML